MKADVAPGERTDQDTDRFAGSQTDTQTDFNRCPSPVNNGNATANTNEERSRDNSNDSDHGGMAGVLLVGLPFFPLSPRISEMVLVQIHNRKRMQSWRLDWIRLDWTPGGR